MLTLDKIYHAKFVLKQVARKTDLIAATRLCPGTDLYLKTENLQVTGSFKVRGAYYKISQLSAEERAKGVIACSAGNHAQGVALAATRMGIKSVVCMPDGAPIMKVESTKRLGAEVELVKGTYDDAHDRAVELQEQTGMTFIHPYDDELVIAGQGTIGLEILDQLPDVDAVIVPIGAAVQGFDFIAVLAAGTDNDDGHRRPTANTANHLDTVQIRQTKIQQHHIRCMNRCLLERFGRSSRRNVLVILRFQCRGNQVADRRIVLHNQNQGFIHAKKPPQGAV